MKMNFIKKLKKNIISKSKINVFKFFKNVDLNLTISILSFIIVIATFLITIESLLLQRESLNFAKKVELANLSFSLNECGEDYMIFKATNHNSDLNDFHVTGTLFDKNFNYDSQFNLCTIYPFEATSTAYYIEKNQTVKIICNIDIDEINVNNHYVAFISYFLENFGLIRQEEIYEISKWGNGKVSFNKVSEDTMEKLWSKL